MFHAHAERSRGTRPNVYNMFNGLQGLCRKPQGDITTLQVQQLRLPFNGAEAGNSSYAIEHDIPGGYDFSSLLDTPADNDSTVSSMPDAATLMKQAVGETRKLAAQD